jgi:hypothetical protein
VNVNCGPAGACSGTVEPCKGPILRLWEACKPKRHVITTHVSDGELTPEQLTSLINAQPAGFVPTLPAPTAGTRATPPPIVVTPLPINSPPFGGLK